ncbi:MAG: hypothetical protein K0S28_1791 [Paucimonas sp.]|nr:hypothetical protein [Paucimonas sp.]
MYFGFLLLLVGWGIFLSHALAFLLVPIFIAYLTQFQILPEERMLTAKFGSRYTDYMLRVGRWL